MIVFGYNKLVFLAAVGCNNLQSKGQLYFNQQCSWHLGVEYQLYCMSVTSESTEPDQMPERRHCYKQVSSHGGPNHCTHT